MIRFQRCQSQPGEVTMMLCGKGFRGVGVLCASAMLLGASAVQAAEAGNWYVGGAVGRAEIQDFPSAGSIDGELGAIGITSSSQVDDRDTAWRLYGGYQFNPYAAVEVGYVDFGNGSFSSQVTAPSVGSISGDTKADGVSVALVGQWPIGNAFAVTGKIGAIIWHSESRVSASGVAIAEESRNDRGTDLMFGIGGRYDFTPSVALRADWDRYRKVGAGVSDKSDIDMLSVGVQFRF